jgi:hypothetical protein
VNERSLENPFASAFRVGGAVLVLVFGAALCLVVPPLMVLAALVGAAFLWTLFRHPVLVLGAVLAFMPIDYLTIELGKFFELPHMSLISACTKEVPLILLTFVLWRRNGFKPVAPDWFLLAYCAVAAVYTLFEGSWVALAIDLNFVIPYIVGRMAVLNQAQEQRWAIRAVWIVAALAVLGMIEIFILGEGPRTLLYASTDAMTENGSLTASFHAVGFEGMREAAGMGGPNGFGALCMIALVIWWVYCRNPLPAAMITAGLICSLTRSAWAGVAVAIPILAFIMDQKKRLVVYAAVGLALFAASIPFLGLSDFLFVNKTGQDLSAEGHRNEIVAGLKYVAEHPLGSGNARVNPLVLQTESNANTFETTYPSIAASYGIPTALCFIAFWFSALRLAWQRRSQLGHAATGILISMSITMVFTIPLLDRRLACWALFPVGLAVRSAVKGRSIINGLAEGECR